MHEYFIDINLKCYICTTENKIIIKHSLSKQNEKTQFIYYHIIMHAYDRISRNKRRTGHV